MWEKNYFKIITLSEERLQCMRERDFTIAKSMKTKNLDINLISEITGLSIDEINKF